jgi:hypothetical protein
LTLHFIILYPLPFYIYIKLDLKINRLNNSYKSVIKGVSFTSFNNSYSTGTTFFFDSIVIQPFFLLFLILSRTKTITENARTPAKIYPTTVNPLELLADFSIFKSFFNFLSYLKKFLQSFDTNKHSLRRRRNLSRFCNCPYKYSSIHMCSNFCYFFLS